MAKENLLWGAPRIHGELMKLGIDNISERTISNIIRKYRTKPPSQTWQEFLHNHLLKYHFHRSLYYTNSSIQNPVIGIVYSIPRLPVVGKKIPSEIKINAVC